MASRSSQSRQRSHHRRPPNASAVLEAATSGGLSALDAARLNVQRAGHDLTLLDGLGGMHSRISQNRERDREESADLASPLSQLAQMQQLVPLGPLATANGAQS